MHELDAFLGPAADALTDDQKDALTAALAVVDARYPSSADEWARANAQGAAAAVALGELTVDDAVGAWRVARLAERESMERLTGALALAAQSEAEAALSARLDLNRQTIRKALGKS